MNYESPATQRGFFFIVSKSEYCNQAKQFFNY